MSADREKELREENERIAAAAANMSRALTYPVINKVLDVLGIPTVDPEVQARADRLGMLRELNEMDGLDSER